MFQLEIRRYSTPTSLLRICTPVCTSVFDVQR